jgi:hypothetical protein
LAVLECQPGSRQGVEKVPLQPGRLFRPRPTVRTSISASSPKFRIRVVRSAAWKYDGVKPRDQVILNPMVNVAEGEDDRI